MKFYEAQLANGLQVIAEINPHVHSLALGFYVRAGARDETADVSGVSHFLEHMAFKGTDKFTAEDVNRIFDEVGAKYNASTSQEVTLFYGAILPEYLPTTFELLSSIIRPSLRDEDFETEKKVILEEIAMYDDQPTMVAWENAMQLHFGEHPLGQSILGTNDSIQTLTSDQMRQYHASHYQAGNIVLAVAGHGDWDEILRMANEYCGDWPAGAFDRPTHEAKPVGGINVVTLENNVQQHVMQMAAAPNARNELRYAAELLSVIVGDDSGSRLYWELVDPGHAEAAELGYHDHDGSGNYLTYLSCEPETAAENLQRIRTIYASVNRDGVTEQELEQAKNKVASQIVLRSERPMGRLSSLGRNWVYRQEYCSVENDMHTLRSLTIKDIRRLLDAYPLAQTTTATVGPLKSLDFSADDAPSA